MAVQVDQALKQTAARRRLLFALRRADYSPLFSEKARVPIDKKDAWFKLLLEIFQAPQGYSEEVLSSAQGSLSRLLGPVEPAIQNEHELGLPISAST